MKIFSDKDGVIALTRKEFDFRIRRHFPVIEIVPEILPSYELLGHYSDDSNATALYFRALLGRDANFDFKSYLDSVAGALREKGIWRDFRPNIGVINFYKKLKTILADSLDLTIITASGSSSDESDTVRPDTRNWVDQIGLDFAKIIHDSKKEKYLDADVWVEDMPSYVIKIFEKGFKGRVLLADHPYNKPESYIYKLKAEAIARIGRIYPTAYVSRADYRSHILDYVMSVGRSPFILSLRSAILENEEALQTEGFAIERNRNDFARMLPEVFERQFALPPVEFAPDLVFSSPRFDHLVSIMGSTEANIILRQKMSRILEKTLERVSIQSERTFVRAAISDWESGWGVPVQFECRSNVYPLNMDSLALATFAHSVLAKASASFKTSGSDPFIVEYAGLSLDSRSLLFSLLSPSRSFAFEMNCGRVSFEYSDNRATLEYGGPRVNEFKKKFA